MKGGTKKYYNYDLNYMFLLDEVKDILFSQFRILFDQDYNEIGIVSSSLLEKFNFRRF